MKTTSKHLITGQNRRHTVSSSESSTIELWHMFAKKSKISSEDVKKWGQNIDMLLADQSKAQIQYFRSLDANEVVCKYSRTRLYRTRDITNLRNIN